MAILLFILTVLTIIYYQTFNELQGVHVTITAEFWPYINASEIY